MFVLMHFFLGRGVTVFIDYFKKSITPKRLKNRHHSIKIFSHQPWKICCQTQNNSLTKFFLKQQSSHQGQVGPTIEKRIFKKKNSLGTYFLSLPEASKITTIKAKGT